MGDYVGEILLVLGLIVLNGFFAASEIALISARQSALKAAAEKGSKGAQAALRLTADPSRLLSAVQIGITFVGFMASATAAVTLSVPVAAWLRSLGVPWIDVISSGAAVALVTLAISYLSIVVGELAPKRLGLQRAEAVAKAVARPVTVLAAVVSPLVWFLARSTDLVGLVMGVKPGTGRPGVTEEEIKLLVTEQGTLLDEEKRMIHEVFELGDTVVREIMVPRVDAEMIEDTGTLEEALALFDRTGFSRLPVYHEDPDKVVGVLLLKDLVGPAAACRVAGVPVVGEMRPPAFVPETMRILELLSEMQRKRNHLAIVVDEYGGTAGIVTMEDIVEEVVGEIADEFDPDRRFIAEAGDGRWVVDGRLPVEDARELLGLPVPESDEYDTLAGWVLSELGHIPVAGEKVRHEGYEFAVQAVRRRRITRLGVTRVAEFESGPTGA